MKLIWTYISQPNRGGAQLATLGLADGLKTSDMRMEFSFSNPGPLIDECIAHGHAVSWVKMPEWYRFKPSNVLLLVRWSVATLLLSLRLFLHIRRKRPDIIYLFGRRDVLLCAPASFLLRIPMIYHLHGFYQENLDIFNRIPLQIARFLGAGIVCNSLATLAIANRNGFASGADVVYNGIDFDPSFDMDRQAARDKMGIEPGVSAIGCASRIAPMKNIDTLLRMAAELKRTLGRPFVLLIAGEEGLISEGRLLRDLKALADELGIADSVCWLGYVHEIGAFYRGLDVFVSLTRDEPFGRVFVEAMGAEVPTIGTRVGGVPEIIEDGRTGFFVEIEDAESAARTVASLLRDQVRAAEIARAGRESVRSRFSLEAHVGEMLKVFSQILKGKG